MELLKDKPEFKETINSFFFKNEIIDIIDEVEVEVDFDDDKDDMITEIVEKISRHSEDITIGDVIIGQSIKDKQELAISIFEILDTYTGEIKVINKNKITQLVIDKVSEFVKENYGISIKEAYLQSLTIL